MTLQHLFELLAKSCAQFDSLFVNIQCAIAFSLEKWTLKFKLLNCIRWTVSVASIKFARYVVCIGLLTYKIWKFGSNPCYHCWNTELFSRGLLFIGAPCIWNRVIPEFTGKDFIFSYASPYFTFRPFPLLLPSLKPRPHQWQCRQKRRQCRWCGRDFRATLCLYSNWTKNAKALKTKH